MNNKYIFLYLNLVFTLTFQDDLKGFDDTILFNINWPGEIPEGLDLEHGESVIVTSSHKEKYQCSLPNIHEKEPDIQDKYEGPSAVELIQPLFTASFCSYRLESYWTYEVCHGRYIRQYHEDREGKKIKLQEYTLGKWDEGTYERVVKQVKETEKDKNYQIPVKKIDNVNLPYLELTLENGTLCDLNNNKPRLTKTLYVCYAHGKNDVYSLKETSTCQYEIVILTPLLCSHPKYKPKETGENQIHCVPLEESPKKPHNLVKLKQESRALRKKSDFEGLRVEFVPLEIAENEIAEPKKVEPTTPIVDTSPVESFLQGKNCLTGGTGWWKYEFCYGKSVEQFHIEKDGRKTSINLGLFDKAKHLEWLEKNPQKRPKPVDQRVQLSHMYTGGSICDKTKKARQTEVKLKCLENSSLHSVSLYLLEPKYCEYILGVESPLICDILARADDNGLIPMDNQVKEVLEETPAVVINL